MTEYMKTPRRLWLLAALALAGTVVGVFLALHYYEIHSGSAGFKSYCNVGSAMNCDVVALSPYATLFFGLPLASFVSGWFLATFFIVLLARNPFWRREALRGALVMTGFASLMSLVFLFVMASVIHSFCLLCLVTDVISLTSLGIVLSLRPEGFSEHKPDPVKWKKMAGVVAFSLLVMVGGLKTLEAPAPNETEIKQRVDEILSTPPVAVNVSDEYPSLGAADAPVTIAEFSDFQCPYCKVGAITLNSLLTLYPGKVRVVFRNFPLSSSCNPKVQGSGHRAACEAAKVARCAHQAGKFKEVYEAIFEAQASLAPGKPVALAEAAGMDRAQLDQCLASPEMDLMLAKEVNEADQLGVQSTPTFFINGRRVLGYIPLPAWRALVERLLQK